MIGISISNIFFKRFSRIYGPEIVVNQTFDDTSWWTVEGESEISGGVARIYSSDGAGSLIKRSGVLTNGRTYRLEFDVIATNGAQLTNSPGNPLYGTTTTGHKVVVFTTTSVDLMFKRFTGITDVSIDNVSCKEVL